MVEVQTQVRVASGVEAIVVKTADRVEPLDSECNTTCFLTFIGCNFLKQNHAFTNAMSKLLFAQLLSQWILDTQQVI